MKRISTSLIILFSLLTAVNAKELVEKTNELKNEQINLNDISTSDFKSYVGNNIEINKNKKLIKIDDIEEIILNNSKELKILEYQIEEAKLLLKSEISRWYPSLNLSSSGFPQYIKGKTYNEFSNDTSNNQIKATINTTLKWDLINPLRIPQINNARLNLEISRISYSIKYRDLILEAYT